MPSLSHKNIGHRAHGWQLYCWVYLHPSQAAQPFQASEAPILASPTLTPTIYGQTRMSRRLKNVLRVWGHTFRKPGFQAEFLEWEGNCCSFSHNGEVKRQVTWESPRKFFTFILSPLPGEGWWGETVKQTKTKQVKHLYWIMESMRAWGEEKKSEKRNKKKSCISLLLLRACCGEIT